MNAHPLRAIRRFFLPALALLAAASAPAQTIITTAPYDITQAGSYRVGANLSVSTNRAVITIFAPNVELDLGGYTLTAPATTDGYVALDVAAVSNVTIRNGTVVGSGFGILFRPGADSGNHLVENVRAVANSAVGIYFQGSSPGSVARNNLVVNAGAGNTQFTADGIRSEGGVLLQDNTVGKVTAPGTSSTGIFAATGDFAIGNTVNDCAVGISGCKCLNNLTNGCATPFSGGTNATGNN